MLLGFRAFYLYRMGVPTQIAAKISMPTTSTFAIFTPPGIGTSLDLYPGGGGGGNWTYPEFLCVPCRAVHHVEP